MRWPWVAGVVSWKPIDGWPGACLPESDDTPEVIAVAEVTVVGTPIESIQQLIHTLVLSLINHQQNGKIVIKLILDSKIASNNWWENRLPSYVVIIK